MTAIRSPQATYHLLISRCRITRGKDITGIAGGPVIPGIYSVISEKRGVYSAETR
ncbi:MAG: hypothetical protein MZV63_23360 [Marinilabiliales bacterium]|nr:hypothetical protein [Marinilabiliales bacterium]